MGEDDWIVLVMEGVVHANCDCGLWFEDYGLNVVVLWRELQFREDKGIASVDGGSLFDCRIPGPSLGFRPSRSV